MDYIEDIKDGGYLPELLDYMIEFLGHSKGKPIDASKLGDWHKLGTWDCSLKTTQSLLVHLYYKSLLHMSSLAKAWWVDCRARLTKLTIESWTEKFISPKVIQDTLSAVASWSIRQEPSEPEAEKLSIFIHNTAGEVTASYPIEDTSCSIRISLPRTFPLHQATVSSISRVALDEKKWQSWLLITQGIIAFNNNDVIEGLITFRRNIVGALKGHTQCAICYSVVSENGRLPNRECRTCRGSFHAPCLFKWFQTGGKSTCPLCRSDFDYI